VILTDREIQISIARGSIIIDPPPSQIAYSSTSVDLTLDSHINRFKKDKAFLQKEVNPTHPEYKIDIGDNGFSLEPIELILAWTVKYVDLPITSRVAARVEGKSSLSRLGIGIHMSTPTIHAGFKGQIQLEIVSHGNFPVLLKAGMRICQLIFEMTAGTPDTAYSGQFQGESTR